MDALACVNSKREVRDYLDKSIPQECLEQILEAGRLAPSSKNSQPWHFIVVKDKGNLRKVAELTPTGKHIAKAPLAIVIVKDGAKLPEVDGARAGQNMILTARALGIGSCWITNFYDDAVKELLHVPSRMKLITVLPFGYPAESKTGSKKVRKSMSEIVHYEKFSSN